MTTNNKIIWDTHLYLGEEYKAGLVNPFNNCLNQDLQDSNYDSLLSFYFAIVNCHHRGKKTYKNRIRDYMFSQAERVAENEILKESEHCVFYRISIAKRVGFGKPVRRFLYGGEWERDETLHSKKAVAINNLIDKIENSFEDKV